MKCLSWCRVLLIQLRNTFLLKKPSNIKGKNREISEMEFDYFLVSNICLTLSQYLILPFQNLTTTRYLQLIHSFTFIYQCCFLKFIKMQNQPKKNQVKLNTVLSIRNWNIGILFQACKVIPKYSWVKQVVTTTYCENLME